MPNFICTNHASGHCTGGWRHWPGLVFGPTFQLDFRSVRTANVITARPPFISYSLPDGPCVPHIGFGPVNAYWSAGDGATGRNIDRLVADSA